MMAREFTEKDLKNLIEDIADIICSIRLLPSPHFEYVNRGAAYTLQYEPAEFYQDPDLLWKIVHPDDCEAVRAMLQIGHPRRVTFRARRRDGKILTMQGHFSDRYNHEVYDIVAIQAVLVEIHPSAASPVEQPPTVELDQRLIRYAEELAIISDIGQTLGEDLNIPDINLRLGRAVRQLFPDSHALFISRYHPEKQEISCFFAMIENDILNAEELDPIPLDYSPQATQSKAILTRQALIVPDLVAHQGGLRGKMIGQEGEIPRSGLYVPMVSKNNVLGVVQIQSRVINRFSEEDARLLSIIANTAASVLQNAETHNQLMDAYDRTLEGWGHAVDLRDRETEGHSQRVADITCKMARKMGISSEAITHVWRGALLHDVGKLGVPDAILLKNGKLTAEEWVEMRKHPQFAYEMLKSIQFIRPSLDIPYCHHERWDGSGYPRGLKGEEIPLSARIFAIVDVWDALLSDRPYRPAWERSEVLAHIQAGIGSHFDPNCAAAFIEMIDAGEI